MRLKRVRIFGFKTFADRTEFDLEGGLVVVTGPNGCGKSNLVDAILWGLGEGNSRQLRAGSKDDIIFAGSQLRKPVNYAEVSLLFDNEDGTLPVDYPEVSVTRRFDRSGNNEYLINRQPCRLRDVHELLADSGLGRSGYAIVGQREIDSALSASAEERRAWIDEAAGVQRYRARKLESARRLAQAETHLERVADLLSEIESQREPLREEAETARRYRSVQASLREIELGLLVHDFGRVSAEVSRLERSIQGRQQLAEKETLLSGELEVAIQHSEDSLAELERQAIGLREELHQLSLHREKALGRAVLAKQKLQALAELEQSWETETEQATHRHLEAESEAAQARADLDGELHKLEELRTSLAGVGEEAESLRRHLRESELALEAERKREADRLRRIAEREHAESRLREVRRELRGLEKSLPDLESGLAEAERELNEGQSTLTQLEDQIRKRQADLEETRRRDALDEQTRRVHLSQLGAVEAKRQGLEMTLETHEGLAQGPRAVLEAVKQGLLPDVYHAVGESIEVERELALAIETALGSAAGDLIVDDPQDAKRAIELLKRQQLGRATFQPIPQMRPVVLSEEMLRLSRQRGIVGRASEHIRFESRFRPVIESLLGRVLVVEDLDVALGIARTSGWSKLVTVEGELVHSAGSVSGGRAAKASYGMLQRRADLVDMQNEIDTLENKVRALSKGIEKRQTERTQIERSIAELRNQREGLEKELHDRRQWRNRVRDEFLSAERQRIKLQEEATQLGGSAESEVSETRVAELETERDDLLRKLAGKSADAESAEAILREAELRVQQARLRQSLAQRRVEMAVEQAEQRERRRERLEPEKTKFQTEMNSAEQDAKEAESSAAQRENQKATLETKRDELRASLRAQREQVHDIRQNVASLLEQIHEEQVAKAKAEGRKATVVERLLEEYGISEAEAVSSPMAEPEPDAAQVVARLRRELKAMGEVNLGAIEAFERLTRRHEELAVQFDDVQNGIKQVHASIRELDRLTRDRFVDTFRQVAVEFTRLFERLFGGGEGRLELSDAENLLDSGVELMVTLPGKRAQRLELLSGGERSLCASAFLFALLAVRPSPLVVLDEVDAPLDGRNVERFVDILLEFAQTIQFIVITHNPTTIAAARNCLGVTMEGGASLLVPVRFPNPSAL